VSTQIGIGFSDHLDFRTAAKNAAIQSKTNLNADRIDFALILCTIHYDSNKFLPEIARILSCPKMIGCSTAGIILSHTIESRGISITTFHSDEIRFGIGHENNISKQDNRQAGSNMARNILDDFGSHVRQLCVFFVNGLIENNSLLLKGIQEVLGNIFPIIGGGACDNFHYKNSFQIFGEQLYHDAATGLILGGQVSVGIGGRHGWRPLGKPRVIDKVENNIIKTINGKKAFALYEEYLGEKTQDLKSSRLGQMAILYPLGIYIEGSNQYLLRNAIDILEDGSIVCQGDVPEGAQVHVMLSNKDSCMQAALEAAKEAKQALRGKQVKFVLIIESMARLKLFGRKAIQEIKKVKEVFGSSVPMIGMYSYGEICPFQSTEAARKPYLQNESIVVMAIS